MVFNVHVLYKEILEASSSSSFETQVVELVISNASGNKENLNAEEVHEEKPSILPPNTLLPRLTRERRASNSTRPRIPIFLLIDRTDPGYYAKVG